MLCEQSSNSKMTLNNGFAGNGLNWTNTSYNLCLGNQSHGRKGATVLPFVWNYVLKQCPLIGKLIYKARGTSDGGPCYGRAVTMAETYATCVEQPACIYWALTASQNLLVMGADAGNAFAKALPPFQKFYLRIDEQFQTWWTQCKSRPPIPKDYVLPVNIALKEGHPESPQLWENHIHKILVHELKFTATTHEKCLYSRPDPTTTSALQLLLREVDDFSVSASDHAACTQIIQDIGQHRHEYPPTRWYIIKVSAM